MKLKRNTWILVVIAVIMGVVVYVSESQWTPKREQAEIEKKQIFDLEEKDIQGVIIEKNGQILEFVRTSNQEHSWQMKQPEDLPASDAAVSFLLSFLTNGESKRNFTISSDKKPDYGLKNPFAKITIKLDNNQTKELVLGLPNLENQFLYAVVDSSNQNTTEIEVSLVPIGLKYAVEKEIEEWKQEEGTVGDYPPKSPLRLRGH